jgi:LPXTG-motif cell wall-anchored protein
VKTRLLVGVLVTIVALACTHTGPADALAHTGPATQIEQEQPILPQTNEDDSPPYLMIALTTLLVAGGCLYLLFRRGSLAYRARQDDEREAGGPTVQ